MVPRSRNARALMQRGGSPLTLWAMPCCIPTPPLDQGWGPSPLPMPRYTGGGDFALLVDGLGQAFLAYDAWGNGHRVSIERLDPTFTDSLGLSNSTGLGAGRGGVGVGG